MKVFYYTFGCKVNQYETEIVKQEFCRLGFEETKKIPDADICVVNTCTVTAQADLKCRQLFHKVRRQNPNAILAVMGCFTQAFPKDVESITDADIIVGTSNKTHLPRLVLDFIQNRESVCEIIPHTKGDKIEPMQLEGGIHKTRATIKIQDGCDRYCSYCIIPYARGVIRSKPLDEIKREALVLSQSGHSEIVLAGINLSLYGKDFNDGTDLADAVNTAGEGENIQRIRLSSLEPELITDSLIEKMKSNTKLCPHFHLSLQSGCTQTLKRMNRHYTADEYYRLVCKLRDTFENCSITTDVMVGFPGETAEEFEESLAFVRKVGFAKCHIFPYSEREGTRAAVMPDRLPMEEKARRAEIMEHAAEECQQNFLKSQVGKTVKVLFERENCTDFHQGYSENYTHIKINRKNIEKSLRRKIFCVRIEGVVRDYCIGEISE